MNSEKLPCLGVWVSALCVKYLKQWGRFWGWGLCVWALWSASWIVSGLNCCETIGTVNEARNTVCSIDLKVHWCIAHFACVWQSSFPAVDSFFPKSMDPEMYTTAVFYGCLHIRGISLQSLLESWIVHLQPCITFRASIVHLMSCHTQRAGWHLSTSIFCLYCLCWPPVVLYYL